MIQTQTNLSLKKLKGIKPKGVKPRPSSKLEKLISITNSVIEKNSKDDVTIRVNTIHSDMHKKIYRDLKQDLLKEIEFSKEDLSAWVYAHSNSVGGDAYKKTLGVCSGVLLTILTERNKRRGKKTILDIDGNNQEFSHLFSHGRKVDELIIRNFVGDSICRSFGDSFESYEGYAKKLCLINISGKDFADFCGYKGKVDSLYLINNSENAIMGKPFAKNIWMVNNNFGSDATLAKIGRANRIWFFNNYANSIKYDAGPDIAELFFNVLKDGCDFNRMHATSDPIYSAKFKNFVFYDPKDNFINFTNIAAKKMLVGEEALNKYGKIIELSNLLDNKNVEEIMTILNQIEKVYDIIDSK